MAAPAISLLSSIAGLILVGGCSEPAVPPPDHVEVRDSAGIPILTFRKAGLEERWILEPEPEWVLGELREPNGVMDLYAVVDAELLDGGLVALAEGSTYQVVISGVDGKVVRRLGRAGDGPGEFRQIGAVVGLPEGRIGVWDPERDRYSEFDAAGVLVFETEVALPAGAVRSNSPLTTGGGPGRDHLWIGAFPVMRPPPGMERFRSEGAIVRLTNPGDTLAVVPGLVTTRLRVGTGGIRYSAAPRLAGDPAGVWIGDTHEPEVRLLGEDGGLRRIVRWEWDEDRVFGPAEQAAYWASIERQMNRKPPVGALADTLPAFDYLMAGGGRLWILVFPADPAEGRFQSLPRTWMVCEFEKLSCGRIATPADFYPARVGVDYVLGKQLDEMGVETVGKYRLRTVEKPAR